MATVFIIVSVADTYSIFKNSNVITNYMDDARSTILKQEEPRQKNFVKCMSFKQNGNFYFYSRR